MMKVHICFVSIIIAQKCSSRPQTALATWCCTVFHRCHSPK